MSQPILYHQGETSFEHLGLGILTDTLSCVVTEERNGVFELEMEYPVTGSHFEQLKPNQLIKADAGQRLRGQLFRIKQVEKQMNGVVRIYAPHVSYLAGDLSLRPVLDLVNMNAEEALATWRNAIIGMDGQPFTVFSDIMTLGSTTMTIQNCENPRKALGGAEGSILDVWGGEYLFDNYHVSLLKERGRDANTLISYGRNLTDLTQEENITNTYTSVYPFAIFRTGDHEEIVTLPAPNFIVDSQHAPKYPHRRILPVDFSSAFDREVRPNVHVLRQLAESYINDHDIGVPQVAIKVSFVELTQAFDHEGTRYEAVNLCDRVSVYFERLGIRTRAQVVRTTWDVLLDQYQSLEIGTIRQSLSDNRRENHDQQALIERLEFLRSIQNRQGMIQQETAGVTNDLASRTEQLEVLLANALLELERLQLYLETRSNTD